jgi:GDP-mannose 6-dehydrogenase
MKISVFGLGYVGCVNIGCLSDMGHDVLGVDIDESKIDLINNGKPTIKENGLDDLFRVNKQFIKATNSVKDAILNTDLSLICIGTPNKFNGELDLTAIYKVADNIGKVLSEKTTFHLIAIRSTVMPGALRNVASILENSSGKKISKDFDVVMNPEFLREGKAIQDFMNPPFTLFGLREENEFVESICRDIYKTKSEVKFCKAEEAEIIKMVNNSWHALKIVFANEVSQICRENKIDSDSVMELFKRDTQLNISSKYLSPGFAYGGSCLPKDLRALSALHSSKHNLFSRIEQSNEEKIESVFRQLLLTHRLLSNITKHTVLVLGLSFKEGTDDVRMSPNVTLVNKLLKEEKTFNVMVHDFNVTESLKDGTNSKTLIPQLGQIKDILVEDLESSVKKANTIIFINKENYNIANWVNEDQLFFELNDFGQKLNCTQVKLY